MNETLFYPIIAFCVVALYLYIAWSKYVRRKYADVIRVRSTPRLSFGDMPLAVHSDESITRQILKRLSVFALPFAVSVDYGYKIPFPYGRCYVALERDVQICALVPFNLFIAFGLWLKTWIVYGLPTWFQKHRFKKPVNSPVPFPSNAWKRDEKHQLAIDVLLREIEREDIAILIERNYRGIDKKGWLVDLIHMDVEPFTGDRLDELLQKALNEYRKMNSPSLSSRDYDSSYGE